MADNAKANKKSPWAGLIKLAGPHKGKMSASRILGDIRGGVRQMKLDDLRDLASFIIQNLLLSETRLLPI